MKLPCALLSPVPCYLAPLSPRHLTHIPSASTYIRKHTYTVLCLFCNSKFLSPTYVQWNTTGMPCVNKNTLSLRSVPAVTDHVSHPHETHHLILLFQMQLLYRMWIHGNHILHCEARRHGADGDPTIFTCSWEFVGLMEEHPKSLWAGKPQQCLFVHHIPHKLDREINPDTYCAVSTVQNTHYVSVIKTSQLMLYREIIAVCSQIHTKHINTLCGQNVELLNVKLVVRILTTGLWRFIYIIVVIPLCHAYEF